MTTINEISVEEWDSLTKGFVRGQVKENPLKPDMVNSPPHYNQGKEAINIIEDSMSSLEFEGYLRGNVMKYLCRYQHKGNPEEDLKKAQWYLAALLKTKESKE